MMISPSLLLRYRARLMKQQQHLKNVKHTHTGLNLRNVGHNPKVFFQIQSHSKKFKTSLQDLWNMLPFVKGNLDRYFVWSLAIFILFLWAIIQIAINYFYFKKMASKRKMPLKAQKKPFQAKSLTLKLNPQPYFFIEKL